MGSVIQPPIGRPIYLNVWTPKVSECQCLPGFYEKPSAPNSTMAGALAADAADDEASPLCQRCPARWTSGYGSR